MRWEGYVDYAETRRAIEVLQAPGEVFEVRIISTSNRKTIISGYFTDPDTLFEKLDTVDLRKRNVYITLGKVREECFSRSQSECFEQTNTTTSDHEIVAYRWLFIDLDPIRPTGVSASDQELQKAQELSDIVYEYMRGLGFPEPVKAMSGNGYHLLYRLDVLNDEDGRALVKRCLDNLSVMFDNDHVKIDTTNSNPSRICKLHGTLAQKGKSTAKRPHRMSRLLHVPDNVEITPIETLQ